MEFIDRRSEWNRLDALLAKPRGGMAVVWGRRRVGKTRLLVEWCRSHHGVYTVADQSSPEFQRRYVAEAIAQRFPGFDSVEYPSWRSLLERLSSESRAAKWRGPLVIDELPYLVAADASLPAALQNWIDHEAMRAGLALVVCGSTQRMTQGIVLEPGAPLYGRASELLEIHPLLAGHLPEAFGTKDPRRAVEWYAVWGGIPRYWELASESPSPGDLEQVVDRVVLDPAGPLHLEPDRLLIEETPPATALRPLLDAIGSGANHLSEIAGRIGRPATSLARPMSRLVELGFVRRELPFGESEKSSRRALYRLADPFVSFWFSVVAPHRSLLAASPPETRIGIWRARRPALEAACWEELCRDGVARLHQVDSPVAAGGPWLPARRFWRGTDPEWDIVAPSADGKRLLLGEARWTGALRGTELDRLAVELSARAIPAVPDAQDREIVRALFVPSMRQGVRAPAGLHVIDAETTLSCLRDG